MAITQQEARKKNKVSFLAGRKVSTHVIKANKIYPNDPYSCGSGKKYKKCCVLM